VSSAKSNMGAICVPPTRLAKSIIGRCLLASVALHRSSHTPLATEIRSCKARARSMMSPSFAQAVGALQTVASYLNSAKLFLSKSVRGFARNGDEAARYLHDRSAIKAVRLAPIPREKLSPSFLLWACQQRSELLAAIEKAVDPSANQTPR
jgi:hypothetical protein